MLNNTAYSVDLSTTGGTATKWIVDWGDGVTTPDTSTFTNSGGFGIQFQTPPHYYQNTGNFPITATAYTAANASAVAALTLNINFGTQNFQGSGKTVYTPYGSTGDSKGQAMAVDHSLSALAGYVYVASNYNDGGHTLQPARRDRQYMGWASHRCPDGPSR